MVVMIKVIIMVVTVKKLMVAQIIQWKSMTVINFQIFVNYDVVDDDDDHDDSNNYNNNDAEEQDSNNDNKNNNIHDNNCLITKSWDE